MLARVSLWVALLSTALATMVLIAPVSFHRSSATRVDPTPAPLHQPR